MCGIVFAVNTNGISTSLDEALTSLYSRGPDEKGSRVLQFGSTSVSVGQTRLAIRGLDTAENSQPLISECGQYSLIYNGEIYNLKELTLKLLGNKKYSGDTSLLFDLLKKYGWKILEKIEGMFSIVFTDRVKNKAYIARDSIGIKPLYYSFNKKQFFAASTIKAIEACGLELFIDKDDLFESLNAGFTSSENSGFKGVYKLIPGQVIELDLKTNLEIKFHKLDIIKDQKLNKKLLEEIINQQSISDVPTCVFFSGGVDSTVIAYGTQTPLLHMQYENSQDHHYAEIIGEKLGKKVTNVPFNNSLDLFAEANFIAKNIEEPISDYTFLSTYDLSNFAKSKGFKVAMSGMGADEVFSGYARYIAFKYLPVVKFCKTVFPSKLFFFLIKFLIPDEKKYLRLISACSEISWATQYIRLLGYFSDYELKNLWLSDYSKLKKRLVNKLNKNLDTKYLKRVEYAKRVDFHGFLQHNLIVADKASMAASVEVRVPFLSEKIVFSDSRNKKKNSNLYKKSFLIEFFSKSVPYRYFSRNKQGFNPPLTKAIKHLSEAVILENFKNTPLFAYLDVKYISKIINEHFSNKIDRTYQIWQLIFLSQWLLIWDKPKGNHKDL